nr:type VI immunity family protein [uncultured Caldimonas sp.]
MLTGAVTLFFRHTNVDFDALREVLVNSVQLVAPGASWFRNDLMERNEASSPEALAEQVDLAIQEMRAGYNFYLFVDSGSTLDSVGPWALRFGYRGEYGADSLGWLQLHVPAELAVERTSEFGALVKRLTGMFPFWHGSAGLSINYDYGEMDPERNLAIRAALERYAGLDGHDLITESRGLLTALKSAQWQTWIHRDLLARSPLAREGAEHLAGRGALGLSMTDGGMLLQAGPVPLLGDRHRNEPVDPYRNANMALAPLLVDNLFPMPGFPDETATHDWLHRLRSAP